MRRKWLRRMALVAGWAAGCVLLWGWVPYRELGTWEAPPRLFWCGVTDEGRTVLYAHGGGDDHDANNLRGPVEFRDARTGEVRRTLFGPDDAFKRISVDWNHAWLMTQQTDPTHPDPNAFRCRLLDLADGHEIVALTAINPRRNVWWMMSKDGTVAALNNFDRGRRQVEWFDIPSGRRIAAFPDYGEVMWFSQDGRRFVASRTPERGSPTALTVWEVPGGQVVATLTPPPGGDPKRFGIRAFSPDGTVLVDSDDNVWDVDTATVRFRLPAVQGNAVKFSADGKLLWAEPISKTEERLLCFDVATGRELAERSVQIATESLWGGSAGFDPRSDGRYWISTGGTRYEPGYVSRQLARIPMFSRLREGGIIDHVVVVDLEAGRVVAHLDCGHGGAQPDGTIHVTDRKKRTRVFDLPPQRSWPWAVALLGGWTLLVGGGIAAGRRWARNRTNPRDSV